MPSHHVSQYTLVPTLRGDSDGLWASAPRGVIAVSSVSGCLSLFGEPWVEQAWLAWLDWNDSHCLWPTWFVNLSGGDRHTHIHSHTQALIHYEENLSPQTQHTSTYFLTLWRLLFIHIFRSVTSKSSFIIDSAGSHTTSTSGLKLEMIFAWGSALKPQE